MADSQRGADNGVQILRTEALPSDFDRLVDASVADGHGFVERLRSEYVSGANDFTHPGEGLWVARIDGQLVGVCGLNRDPYTSDSGVGRVRHLYVLSDQRLAGVGRLLVQAVFDQAREHFEILRLRTNSPDADRFYLRIGFATSDVDPYGTHLFAL